MLLVLQNYWNCGSGVGVVYPAILFCLFSCQENGIRGVDNEGGNVVKKCFKLLNFTVGKKLQNYCGKEISELLW